MSSGFNITQPAMNNAGPKRRVNSDFNLRDYRLKAVKKVPYSVRIQHCSGSVCVACNKLLSESDMYRRGFASGAELGLCGSCATYVSKIQYAEDDGLTPTIGEVEHEDDESRDSAFNSSASFNPDYDPNY